MQSQHRHAYECWDFISAYEAGQGDECLRDAETTPR